MDVISIFKMIAAGLTGLTGLLALVRPASVYDFTGLAVTGPRGVSEIRAIFGGLFIALGVAPFFLGIPAYRMLGIGYLAIALVRLVSIFIDSSTAQSNLISLGIEILFGIILAL